MRKLGIFIIILVLLLLATTLLLFSLQVKGTEIVSSTDYVRIDSFRFCGISRSSSENTQKLSVCGLLVSDKESVPIRIYLYKMPGEIFVSENPVDDRFSIGKFVREFDLPNGNNTGHYKIVAYFYKEIVGEAEFEIHSP
jgi:hypothetical protein